MAVYVFMQWKYFSLFEAENCIAKFYTAFNDWEIVANDSVGQWLSSRLAPLSTGD